MCSRLKPINLNGVGRGDNLDSIFVRIKRNGMGFPGEEPKSKALQHMVYAVCDLKGGGREALPELYSEGTRAETTPGLGPFCDPPPVSQRGGVGSGNAQDKSSHSELEEAGCELPA